MFKNYLKIAYRNLLKNKIFSFVNIFGLAIGMAACFFIFQYVHFESSYDRFNKNAANLYRVPKTFTGSMTGNGTKATNDPAAGPTMKSEFPEVLDFARVVPISLFLHASTITYNDNKGNKTAFNEERVYVADSSFFRMFSYPFIKGSPGKALSEANAIVISGSEAKKYFGKEDPLGKTLYLNQLAPLKVTGVFNDVPENSHIKFNMLISFKTLGNMNSDASWAWPEFYTYVLLAPGTDPKKLEAKFPAFIGKHLGSIMKKLDFGVEYQLQRVMDIHLNPGYHQEPEANGSEKEIYLLSMIGVFLLVIAWINYINLTTAKSLERAKEVGLRKVVGAARIQLLGQFIMESAIINLLALLFAALIVCICNPYFGQFIGKNISPGLFSSGLLREPLFWLGLFVIFAAGAFLIGSYPALLLSAFKPAQALKGKFFQSNTGISRRKVLVFFQFILSILLIAATTMVYRQLSYMRTQPLGYDRDQMVIVKVPPVYDSTAPYKMRSFKAQILQNPSVNSIAASSDIPGQTIVYWNSVRKASEDQTHNFGAFQVEIDDHFIKTFQMSLAAGRNFQFQDSSNLSGREKTRVIVNEEVVKGLGFSTNEAAINQAIAFGSGRTVDAEIIGVVKNYHQRTLKDPYDPILYYYPAYNDWKYFSLNVNINNLQQNLASIENLYKSIFPGHPFEYFFLNEYFDRQYKADQRFGKIFALFTILAILVACLGLLGLSTFVIRLRTKEIGIRKVLGATISSIILLFYKDFFKLLCLATVISIPIIYFMAERWLRNYAFHARLSWLIFAMPPLLLLAISLLTISLQSGKAALANPVKSLKTE